MTDRDERMRILEMIESGKISAAEGLRLLEALDDESPALGGETFAEEDWLVQDQLLVEDETPDVLTTDAFSEVGLVHRSYVEVDTGERPGDLSSIAVKWRYWWMIPLIVGAGIAALGGMFMYLTLKTSGFGFWFLCAWVPFLTGVLIMVLALLSRTAPWLHLRIRQQPGERLERIVFSFPIPIRPTAWFLRNFGHKIPNLEETSMDEIILAIGESTSLENPIYIQVDEGEDGERVEIFIG